MQRSSIIFFCRDGKCDEEVFVIMVSMQSRRPTEVGTAVGVAVWILDAVVAPFGHKSRPPGNMHRRLHS